MLGDRLVVETPNGFLHPAKLLKTLKRENLSTDFDFKNVTVQKKRSLVVGFSFWDAAL